MKLFIPKLDTERIGGGWTFGRNFVRGMGDAITSDYNEADAIFILSPSMVQREDIWPAKADGKKIILRVDNAVRNSRNRNTGMTRMKDFFDWADLVIYQSNWAKEYLGEFLGADTKRQEAVILNGVELDNYHDNHESHGQSILYSRFNRDETKNWEVARYWFSRYFHQHPLSHLFIVGQFSPELRDGNFDFYNEENYSFLGVQAEGSMARLYSTTDLLYTYYNDACSNTLIEALVSGAYIYGDEYYRNTGGAAEIIANFKSFGRDYFSIERMCTEYKIAIGRL